MKLSLVVSVYNDSVHIRKFVKDITPFLSDDIELIVVDDGSTDSTASAIAGVCEGKRHIKSLHLENNVGPLEARLAGAEICHGDYVYFVDADDSVSEAFFHDIPSVLSKESPDVLLIGAERVFPGRQITEIKHIIPPGIYCGDDVKRRIWPQMFCTGDLYGNRPVIPNVWTKIFQRELLLDSTTTLRMKRFVIGEDLAISVAALTNAHHVIVLPYKPYYQYFVNPNSTMRNYKKNLFEETAALCDWLETISIDSEFQSGVCRERAFFAISAYYNEFFFKSSRNKNEKLAIIEEICQSKPLKSACEKISLNEIKFPNTLVMKLITGEKVSMMMAVGGIISAFRRPISRFVVA